MTSGALRISFRQHLRDQALKVAHDVTVDKGWDKVRLTEIARLIGVSRPMLYKEFGDKQGLGDALVLREAERFVIGIQKALNDNVGHAAQAIREAVQFSLDEAEASPLLRAVLTAKPVDSETGTGVLPLLTTSSSLLELISAGVVEWFLEHFSELDSQDVADAVDALVRLAISHLALPAADSIETGRRISSVALRYLALE